MNQINKLHQHLSAMDNPGAMLAALLTDTPMGIQLFNHEGLSVFTNSAYVSLFGHEPMNNYCILKDAAIHNCNHFEEIRNIFSGNSGPHAQKVQFAFDQKGSDWQGTQGGKKTVIKVKATALPIYNSQQKDKLDFVCFFYNDLSQEGTSAERLVRAESRLRALFETGGVGIFVSSDKGVLVEANSAFLNMVGYTEDDLRSRKLTWAKLVTPEYLETTDRARQEVLGNGTCLPFQVECFRKDGSKVHALLGGSAADNTATEIVGVALDLSEQRELEQQFRQSQKMEAVGRLAGGVAHDFNNMLSIIMLQAEQALAAESVEEMREDINSLISGAERATRLTRQLLAFSRKQVFEKKSLSLNSIVEDMKPMITRLLGEDMSVVVDLGNTLHMIQADMSQIEQAVLNLVVNAKDATPSGGTISIATENVHFSESHKSKFGLQLPAGDYVCLKVSDTGCGMTEEVMSQIFEPFFTTKEKGKGTGLGLSTVFGIVKQFDGDIRVRSKVNQGTTFELYFPTVKTNLLAPDTPTATPALNSDIEANVLLVEDEEVLREATASILKKRKYNVIEAQNGKDAQDIFEKQGGNIQLIITDVIMPEMTGPTLIENIRKTYPNSTVKVLYLSGYTLEELGKYGVSEDNASFLEKPFSTQQLVSKVREALSQDPGATGSEAPLAKTGS